MGWQRLERACGCEREGGLLCFSARVQFLHTYTGKHAAPYNTTNTHHGQQTIHHHAASMPPPRAPRRATPDDRRVLHAQHRPAPVAQRQTQQESRTHRQTHTLPTTSAAALARRSATMRGMSTSNACEGIRLRLSARSASLISGGRSG